MKDWYAQENSKTLDLHVTLPGGRVFCVPGGRLDSEKGRELVGIMHASLSADVELLAQALAALKTTREGLLLMREHAQWYGEVWARAAVAEYRNLAAGSAKEKFDALAGLQKKLGAVASGVVDSYDAIDALEARLSGRQDLKEPLKPQ